MVKHGLSGLSWLEMTKKLKEIYCFYWLEKTLNGWNGYKLLEMDKNGRKLKKVAGHEYKWLE